MGSGVGVGGVGGGGDFRLDSSAPTVRELRDPPRVFGAGATTIRRLHFVGTISNWATSWTETRKS